MENKGSLANYSRKTKEGTKTMALMDFFKKKASGNVAKDRLKLVLVSDRAGCSPEILEQIKNDIIQVISKYIVIDQEGLDIKIGQTESDGNNGNVPALFANIPIKDLKHNK
jgi:cell division topological specificity factor